MKTGGPNQEDFEKLLRWLDPDRDRAGEKYEKIRLRLVRIFSSRGCYDADDLADRAMNVVTSKIDWLVENYVGDPAVYFYGVARKIYLENFKKRPRPDVPAPDPQPEELEQLCGYLDDCLNQLTPKERNLVLGYHEFEKREKIRYRKKLAEEFNISRNALRIKVCHIHARLKKCIESRLRGRPVPEMPLREKPYSIRGLPQRPESS